MGLLTEVVPEGRHLDRALEIAEALARFPQDTMLADRRAAIEGIGLPFSEGMALEARSGPLTFGTAAAGRGALRRRRGPRRRRAPAPKPYRDDAQLAAHLRVDRAAVLARRRARRSGG